MDLPTPDTILIPSPSPNIIIYPTNDTYHAVVLLETKSKLNTSLQSLIEEPVVMGVLLLLLNDDYPDVNSSLINNHKKKYMYCLPYISHLHLS